MGVPLGGLAIQFLWSASPSSFYSTSGRKRTKNTTNPNHATKKNGTSARSLLVAWNPWLLKERSFTITPDSRPHSKHDFIPTSTNQTAQTTPLPFMNKGQVLIEGADFPRFCVGFRPILGVGTCEKTVWRKLFVYPTYSMGTHFSFIFRAYN